MQISSSVALQTEVCLSFETQVAGVFSKNMRDVLSLALLCVCGCMWEWLFTLSCMLSGWKIPSCWPRWTLPQVFVWRTCGEPCFAYSWVSLDSRQNPSVKNTDYHQLQNVSGCSPSFSQIAQVLSYVRDSWSIEVQILK